MMETQWCKQDQILKTWQDQNNKTKTKITGCKQRHLVGFSLQDQDQDWFFWSQTGLVLRPTVSDHITETAQEENVSKTDLTQYKFHYRASPELIYRSLAERILADDSTNNK